MTGAPAWMWAVVAAAMSAMIAIDLGVFSKKPKEMSARASVAWTVAWASLAFAFAGLLWAKRGADEALAFLTVYGVEKALSIDNLFVFAAVFSAFAVEKAVQHRVLAYGVLGAVVARAVMILGAGALLARVHGLGIALGVVLVALGLKLAFTKTTEAKPEESRILARLRRWIPSTDGPRGDRFFVREGGRWLATPLLFVLVAIEVADVAFGLESIPAGFGITPDPFIVLTANLFAMLGLRSLFFALSAALTRFKSAQAGLAWVLVFVGAKVVAAPWFEIPVGASLLVIIGIVLASVVVGELRSAPRPASRKVSHSDAWRRPRVARAAASVAAVLAMLMVAATLLELLGTG